MSGLLVGGGDRSGRPRPRRLPAEAWPRAGGATRQRADDRLRQRRRARARTIGAGPRHAIARPQRAVADPGPAGTTAAAGRGRPDEAAVTGGSAMRLALVS